MTRILSGRRAGQSPLHSADATTDDRPPPAIRLRGVIKRYGPVAAVNGLDLVVPSVTCVGLLGPNGAGKTTTMRLLTAQSIADADDLEVLGRTLPGDSKLARADMRVVPQLDNLDTRLTVSRIS